LRILAACWIQSPPVMGSRLALGTGAVSVLGFEHETRVISMWNRTLD
jgi:probable phosphoglycerate mutase